MTHQHVVRIGTIEIPVMDLEASISWYGKYLGLSILTKAGHSAMMAFTGNDASSYPTLYLVETSDHGRLAFKSTHTDINHSVIDFYVPDLESFHTFLAESDVQVTPLHLFPDGKGLGGFGFNDPNGNSFGASNIVHS